MLTCKCLNIVINNTSSDIEKIDVESVNLSDTEKSELFFQQDIGRVNLGNIIKEQPSLVAATNVGDWIIHQCLNCRLFTHAIQKDKGAANVLVNLKLLANDNQIKALRSSEHYSIAFRIVVNQNDIALNDTVDLPARVSSDNLAFCSLQQKLNEVLRLETQATEDRIRKYSEQQYTYLDNFKERAKREHRILTRLILGSTNNTTTENNKNTERSKDFVEMYNSASNPVSIPNYHSKHVLKPKNNVVNSLASKMKRDSSRTSKFTNSLRAESYDSEGLFQLEGVMDDSYSSNNKTQSDIESDTDDSQGGYEDNVSRSRTYSANLAKSLPMNVPTFMSPYSRNAVDIDDDQSIEDPLDIAASIKAIAKSVHGDAVFGDLPRPRFSSQI